MAQLLTRLFFCAGLDPVELMAPELLVIFDPIVHRLKLLGVEAIDAPAAPFAGGDNPNATQYAQVFGDRRLGNPQRMHQGSDLLFATPGEQVDDLPAARLGDGVEYIRGCSGTGHIDIIFPYRNISTGKFANLSRGLGQ